MIDKLTIASNDMDLERLKLTFGETITARPPNNLYDLCHRVSSKTGKHLFTAYSGPRNPNMKSFRLEINPSKLDLNYVGILKRLDESMILDEASIQRIDHATDYEVPVLEAFECVRVKYKRNLKAYSDYQNGNLTGFYVGSKFELVAIYNKAYELKGKTFKSIKQVGPQTLTRFEVRHFTKKVPYRALKELPCLLNFNPYAGLEFLELSDPARFEEFKKKNRVHGMQNSYINLNKQNNFRRDYSKHFIISDLAQKLATNYRDNLGQFFEGVA